MTFSKPNFRTRDCTVKCCGCGNECLLYWVKDEIWLICESAANCCGGHLCIPCAEAALGRQLQLSDVSIEKYLLTSQNSRLEFNPIPHCVHDTVIGAANQAGVEVPYGWCYMWQDYYELGRKLSEQTPEAAVAVQDLISDTLFHFPNFKNPYQ